MKIVVEAFDFEVLSIAAQRAEQCGDARQAIALDVLARKVSAVIANMEAMKTLKDAQRGTYSGFQPISWSDLPSNLKQAI